jgi:hypothetical protein
MKTKPFITFILGTIGVALIFVCAFTACDTTTNGENNDDGQITSDAQFWQFLGAERPKIKLTHIGNDPVIDSPVIDLEHHNQGRFYRYNTAGYETFSYTFYKNGTLKEEWADENDAVWNIEKTTGGYKITDHNGRVYKYELVNDKKTTNSGARDSATLSGIWTGSFEGKNYRIEFDVNTGTEIQVGRVKLTSVDEGWDRYGAWKTSAGVGSGTLSISFASFCPDTAEKNFFEASYSYNGSGNTLMCLGTTWTRQP